MIRRLIYHSFWNLYDNLGTLVVVGLAHLTVSIGMFLALLAILQGNGVIAYVVVGFAEAGLLALVAAGVFYYCARAAEGLPARANHFFLGLKRHGFKILGIIVTFLAVLLILMANLRFYTMLHNRAASGFLEYGALVIAALTGWFVILLWLLLPPVIGVLTYKVAAGPFKASLRQAIMVVVLNPLLWIVVAATGAGLLAFGVWSRAGLLLFLPGMAVVTQSALWLSLQFQEFLAQAKSDVPDGKLVQLKRRARELAEEWELQQPARTFKEIIKPWEY